MTPRTDVHAWCGVLESNLFLCASCYFRLTCRFPATSRPMSSTTTRFVTARDSFFVTTVQKVPKALSEALMSAELDDAGIFRFYPRASLPELGLQDWMDKSLVLLMDIAADCTGRGGLHMCGCMCVPMHLRCAATCRARHAHTGVWRVRTCLCTLGVRACVCCGACGPSILFASGDSVSLPQSERDRATPEVSFSTAQVATCARGTNTHTLYFSTRIAGSGWLRSFQSLRKPLLATIPWDT